VSAEQALLSVVRGEPTAEELAAMSHRRERRRLAPVGAWADFSAGHRRPLRPGPGGWRAGLAS
jgi:hypothetical protein